MDNQSLLVRIVAAGLPLVLIGLVFGAIGYATKDPDTTQIPPLADAPSGPNAVRGEIADVSGGQISLIGENGERLTYSLPAGVTVEALRPIGIADLQTGDWLNGGAIPHPDTILALERLIVLTEPVTP